ncbi:MAG: hypothetical protein QNK11_06570, partial [Legionella sp.]|nr:hypothetical protein [Legionella sp.]
IPSIGPTIVLPLPAGLATTLTEDMESEAAAQNNCMDDIEKELILDKHASTSLSPDYVFKISNLDTQAMRAHIKQIQADVETGQTAYQLVPAINAIRFFREIPLYLTYDPLDIGNPEHIKRSLQTDQNVYNCATLVDDILDVGGMPSRKPSFWASEPTTPNTISERVSESRLNK